MSRDKQNIKTTDWLTRGMTEAELVKEKKKAINEAETELRNKQIGEMTIDLAECCVEVLFTYTDEPIIDIRATAENMANKGYRKSTDVAKEIFAGIEETVKKAIRVCDRYAVIPMLREAKMGCYKDLLGYIEKLKKKYESEGER